MNTVFKLLKSLRTSPTLKLNRNSCSSILETATLISKVTSENVCSVSSLRKLKMTSSSERFMYKICSKSLSSSCFYDFHELLEFLEEHIFDYAYHTFNTKMIVSLLSKRKSFKPNQKLDSCVKSEFIFVSDVRLETTFWLDFLDA